ncbi:phosphoglycerate mutase-like protein [Sistotremastrum niveocremeum HHB9708]|uniref:Phosphoglycerate mutase-like protein n=1 Tax=Sistotremastrum niveocremeum HHB9708 TaxID=1314777 RepID=A0A164Y7K2_9AGAM|nr:phosphoglycerate mutase-like protein [Sistotremastrum niveocremeum HHB9708]
MADESQALLSTEEKDILPPPSLSSLSSAKGTKGRICPQLRLGLAGGRPAFLQLVSAFLSGIVITLLVQFILFPVLLPSPSSSSTTTPNSNDVLCTVGSGCNDLASPDAGSTTVHDYPPPSPTNNYPSSFPIDVGYPGPTPTGGEAALVLTAPSYPGHTVVPFLVSPASLPKPTKHSSIYDSEKEEDGNSEGRFDLFKSWGNLSPWYTVPSHTFGLPSSSPSVPDSCVITGLHFLHRHGARYPTRWSSYAGPASFATRLHNDTDSWEARGDLEFLNDWTYKLGEEVLTPFGRQQLYDLGVSLRLKYGFLLENFTKANELPVFRTESQDRMLASAQNFALGFFGWPLEGKYHELVTIESPGFNNTLAPYETCPNARDPAKGDRGLSYLKEWAGVYLEDARGRFNSLISGYEFSVEDVYSMQQMCAYETVAIGYSKFCELFTKEEWDGFQYSTDLYFWYSSGPGSPVSRIQGIGYIQELLSRLTNEQGKGWNQWSSLNTSVTGDEVLFPLGRSLYVDATHEVVVMNIITALNLTNFASSGPLPSDRIVHDRAWVTSRIAPFATNVQFQLLECTRPDVPPTPQIRIIINDAPTPLTGIANCPSQVDGMCPLSTFVESQKELIGGTSWEWACRGDWTVEGGRGWETVTGDPPARP